MKQETRFTDLQLAPEIYQVTQQLGYQIPTPIQAEMIPHMLSGRDVLGQAQTGTGKTAAFALPILSSMETLGRVPQVLVLAPTRELAIQVADSFQRYAANLPHVRVAAVYGGQDIEIQRRRLKQGAQIVVGTPGRTIDLIKRNILNVDKIRCLVLDEADEMLNMGFLGDVQWVLEQTPAQRQICLFSATMPEEIRTIAQQYLNQPIEIRIRKSDQTVLGIRQRCLVVKGRDKLEALIRILHSEQNDGVIVFARTRGDTLRIADRLAKRGFAAMALNGDMAQAQRVRTVEQLKSGQLDVLVATDVAARGLDIQRISHVFNFDFPHDPQAYVHRIGRTGRAGRNGEAILFISRNELRKLRSLEQSTGRAIERMKLPTIESVNERRKAQFLQELTEILGTQNVTRFQELIDQFSQQSGHSIEQIAAALAYMAYDPIPRAPAEQTPASLAAPKPDHLTQQNESTGRRPFKTADQRAPRKQRFSSKAGMTSYRVEVGRVDQVRPANLVGAIANETGLDSGLIGRVKILDDHSTVDLPNNLPTELFRILRRTWVAGKQLKISPIDRSADRSSSPRFRQQTKNKTHSRHDSHRSSHQDSAPSHGKRASSKRRPASGKPVKPQKTKGRHRRFKKTKLVG